MNGYPVLFNCRSDIVIIFVFSNFTVQYSFPGEVLRSWRDNGAIRFEGVCKFSIPTTIKPEKKDIIIDFGRQVTKFEVLTLIDKLSESSAVVLEYNMDH